MDLGISGKRAFVTGASQGIGRAIAEALAAEGVKVIISSRNRDKCSDQALNIAQKYNTEAHGISCDLSNSEDIERAVNMVQVLYGGVDILVNNSGAFDGGVLEDITFEEWDRVISVNVTGMFLCTRQAFRIMKKQG